MNTVRIDPRPLYTLSPYLFMQFAEPLGTADSSIDAAWDFLHDVWQPKAVEMFRKMAPPMLRWGGCFSSYYHWRDAVGPFAERRPMHNLCWDGIYLNRVGTAELAELAATTGSELLFCVNFESDGRKPWARPRPDLDLCGTAEEAAAWVRYCNDPDDELRLSHGRKEPYGVRYWQIGNETSYDPNGFTSAENAAAAKRFVKAMRAADPHLRLIVWGDGPNAAWSARYREGLTCDWTRDICEAVGPEEAELVAFHNHWGGWPESADFHGMAYREDPDRTWERLMNVETQTFEDRIKYMRDSAAPYGRKLAITEAHLVPKGRHRGDVLSSWAAGAAYARCANILQRHGDMVEIATLADFMGNRWQNNAVMLPTPIRTSAPYLLPVGTVMTLYSHHIGEQAVRAETRGSVDLAASRTGDRLFVHMVNTDRTRGETLAFECGGRTLKPEKVYEIAADSTAEVWDGCPDLFAPREVVPEKETYVLPAAGVAVAEFTLR